jgi:hypothetical protein
MQPPKKKGKGCLIAAIIVGSFVVLGGAAGGFWYYTSTQPMKRSDSVGSCDMRGGLGETQICMDLTEINPRVEQICSSDENYKLARGKGCDTKESLGGCASPRTITWYYPSSEMKSADDVKKKCYGDAYVKP